MRLRADCKRPSGSQWLRAAAAILLAVCAGRLSAQAPAHPFAVEGDHFTLNGRPFMVIAGEMHYARIPRAYWRQRMQMAKAMGINTLATYVFWNVHEPRPGVYDFAGNADLAEFIRMAQSEGLHVLLRAGPYSCAEWEFGGFPAWLMKDPRMTEVLRSNDPAFMVPVARWITRLAAEVKPLLAENGGPIIAVQVENEYGNFGNEPGYMQHMLEIFKQAGFGQSFLYTVSPGKGLKAASLDGVYAGVNFGTANAPGGLAALAAFRPGQPLFATEYWPGWFDHWGHPHETRSTEAQVKDLDYIFSHKASVNIYMFHGGTSFGFMSGSSWTKDNFLPDVTSYDYDAPLDEAGHVTPKYMAYREVIGRYTAEPLPPVPAAPPVMTVAAFALSGITPLWDRLPAPVMSEQPLTMEQMDQAYGYVLYRKQLPAAVDGDLVLDAVHDYAMVFVDGRQVGTIDRRLKQDRIRLVTGGAARLDILVENSGRINSTKMMRGETKGITHSVKLGGTTLTGWQNFSLPMDTAGTMRPESKQRVGRTQPAGPHFEFGSFRAVKTDDTFLDVSALGKGAVWINGHALGRYWNEGPQKTLYVPGPWLRRGLNNVVVLDLFSARPDVPKLAGLAKPMLNAPTAGPVEHAPDAVPAAGAN